MIAEQFRRMAPAIAHYRGRADKDVDSVAGLNSPPATNANWDSACPVN